MRAIFIGLKDILILLRDRKSLTTIILTPLILTLILGTALGSLWGDGQSRSLGTLLVLNHDKNGEISQILIDDVYGSEEFSTRFSVELIDDKHHGENLVHGGDAIALVIIPEGFSEDTIQGEMTAIEIIGDAGNQFLPPVIFDVTEIFVDEVATRLIALEISEQYMGQDDYQLIEDLLEEIKQPVSMLELVKDSSHTNLINEAGTNPVTAMGYYSAAMGVMYLLFNANLGGRKILIEREQGTLQRLKVCKTSLFEFVLGKTLGIYFSALLQFLILITVTTLVYNVNWGSTADVLIYSIIVVFAASGIGMFIASLASSSTAADGLGTFIVLGMSALGGSMWPIYGMPAFMAFLSNFTFNRWAIDGFAQIMFGDAKVFELHPHILTLLGIGVVTLLIAIIRLTKMEVK